MNPKSPLYRFRRRFGFQVFLFWSDFVFFFVDELVLKRNSQIDAQFVVTCSFRRNFLPFFDLLAGGIKSPVLTFRVIFG